MEHLSNYTTQYRVIDREGLSCDCGSDADCYDPEQMLVKEPICIQCLLDRYETQIADIIDPACQGFVAELDVRVDEYFDPCEVLAMWEAGGKFEARIPIEELIKRRLDNEKVL